MFPLGTVLVPGMSLPLHVFEPRYRALAQRCVDEGLPFGVTLIARGFEVGGGEIRHDLGCLAEIEHAVRSEDGRWGLLCKGSQRFDVIRWLDDDPYPQAEIRLRPDPVPTVPAGAEGSPTEVLSERVDALKVLLRRTLAVGSEVGMQVQPATVEIADDPIEATWNICELAPIGDHDRFEVLGVDDPFDRVETLTRLVAGARELIQYEMDSAEPDGDDALERAVAEWSSEQPDGATEQDDDATDR